MSLRHNSKADAQKQCHKVGDDTVEVAHKRVETMEEIRNSKQEENMLKICCVQCYNDKFKFFYINLCIKYEIIFYVILLFYFRLFFIVL